MAKYEFEKVKQYNKALAQQYDVYRIKVLDDSRWKNCPGFVMGETFCKNFERARNVEIYPDDIWLTGYLKTGSTWAQELIWLLNKNLDFDTARNKLISERFPCFE